MASETYVLPDILAPDLDIVFVGSAVATVSRDAGHYYAHPRNSFWRRLHQCRLTPTQLRLQDDTALPKFGIGLTNLNKTVAQSGNVGLVYDVHGFLSRIMPVRPAIVAFNGRDHVKEFCSRTGNNIAGFGLQTWSVGESLAVVLRSSSAGERIRGSVGMLLVVHVSAIEYWHELSSLLPRGPKG